MQILALLDFFEGGSGITQASARGVERSFVLIFELVDIFSTSPMPFCGRIYLVARFHPVLFPRISEPTEFAPEVHTFV